MKKLALCFALAAAGCAPLAEQASLPSKPFAGPVPIKTSTPADAALECLSRMPEVRNSKKVFAVHIINDRTQKYS
ncbi:hypothetical protein, partial [Tateyamaria sp. syn59]|uniref:hypothetical protein n=1 Tax=Tateyamaria sp. syn59 TaxID=2576942 RepID=UPI0016775515